MTSRPGSNTCNLFILPISTTITRGKSSHFETLKPLMEMGSAFLSTDSQKAKCRRHRGAAARARRRQRAADHQGTTLAAPAPVSQPPAPPAPGEVSAPAGPHHDHLPQRRPLFPIFLPSPSPSTGRRRVMSLARLPLPSFASLNIDGHPPSPPPPPLTSLHTCDKHAIESKSSTLGWKEMLWSGNYGGGNVSIDHC